jgi:predicted RNase H-like HicB family nuclease
MSRKQSASAAAYTYAVLLQPEPEGGYTVTCPTLPGLVTYCQSLDEARAMAADAIRGYIKCLREDGEPIPESDPAPVPLVDRVSLEAAGDAPAAGGIVRRRGSPGPPASMPSPTAARPPQAPRRSRLRSRSAPILHALPSSQLRNPRRDRLSRTAFY